MKSSRRQWLRSGLYAGVTVAAAPGFARSYAANEKLRMACIGIGGQGGRGLGAAGGQQLVAVADVNLEGHAAKALAGVTAKFPDVKTFTDFRKLFDAGLSLDAVWIATPDHNHFPAAIRAMEAGIATFSEKPLTHNVYEARKLAEVARKKKVVTQMGNQGHGGESIRLLCEYIWQGTLGDVTEVWSSANANYMAIPRKTIPLPKGMDWEAWLGPAPHRDYHEGIHPFKWRGWLDFGTGGLGDFFCHNADGAVWALKLDQADSVEVEAVEGAPIGEGFPPRTRVIYRFPARGDMAPLTFTWTNDRKPGLVPRPAALEANRDMRGIESTYIGTKGTAVSGGWMGGVRLIPDAFQKETGKPKPVLPRVGSVDAEFLKAARVGGPTCANFEYSARLTEIAHLGNIACRVGLGEKLLYNFKTGAFTSDKANAFLCREPRKGWEFGYA
jgi:predicted dehydrogenase